jgi:hypothetical protein
MKYKIVKPKEDMMPFWVEGMNYLNGHIIDEKEISIRHHYIGVDYFPIIVNDCLWNINTQWIVPVSEEKQFLLGL